MEGEVLDLNGERYDTTGSYLQFFPDTGDCGQILVIDLDFTTSTRNNDRSDLFWYPTLLRAGIDRLAFPPLAGSTNIVAERLEVFDLNGRLVDRSINQSDWTPGSHLPSGVYLFRAQIRVNGARQVLSGKVLLSR